MSLVFTTYSLIFIATTLVSFFVAFLAWRRRSITGAKELALLMIAAGFGAFWVIFSTAATTVPLKIFFAKLEYIGGLSTPVFYLIFVLRFTGKYKFLSRKYILYLFVVPLLTLLLTLTNEKHHLVWSGFSAISEKTNIMEFYHGVGFWIGNVVYSYLMLFLSSVIVISFILHQNKPFRSQGLIILVGGLFPWIASIVYITGNNPVPGLDITPGSIVLSGVIGAFAILNSRFLDLVPVARKTLVETLPDGILALDEQNRIQDINKAALSFLGITTKKYIGIHILSAGASVKQLLDAIVDQEKDDHTVETQGINETKTFRILNHDIKRPSGSRLVIIRDISDQVTWQKEIQAGEERYRHMFSMFRLMADNTDDFLWAKDINGRYTFVNKTMCDRLLMAENVSEPLGKTYAFFVDRERETHPDNPDWYTFGKTSAETDAITLRDRKPQQSDEFGYIRGQFLYLDVHKAPIWDDRGNLVGLVGTGRDVTLTRQLENEKASALELLQKNEDHLRRINAEKDKFFSIIAHDLRGPFGGFLGLTNIMTEELPNLSMDEIRDLAITLKDSATTLYRLLENLLQWSNIQRGLMPFNPQTVLLKHIFDDSIALISDSAREKEITITNTIPEGLEVFADVDMLQSIMRNMVSNAVKFTPRSGKVELSAKATSNNSVEISIQDTGIGMNQTIITNLFKLDAQTNRAGTEGEPSSGLGLLLCKEFIEKHGGTIRVESEEGRGSVFQFTFPNAI